MSTIFGPSLSGARSALQRQDTTANNIANVLTPGFQAQRADQVDIASGGSRVAANTTLRSPGPIEVTGNPFDLAVDGEGFFQVSTADGGTAFTRAGLFRLDANRNLVTAEGNLVTPPVQIPQDATAFQVSRQGQVQAFRADGTVQQVGQIQLAGFPNPGGLSRLGNNLLGPTAASGAPLVGDPGQGPLGSIVSGAVEGSNVDLASETIDTVTNRSTFAANLKVISAQDQMLGDLLDLRG